MNRQMQLKVKGCKRKNVSKNVTGITPKPCISMHPFAFLLKHKTLQFSELQRFSINQAEREGFEPPDL